MLSRVADSLYWMSRYLERAEHTARLFNVDYNLRLDNADDTSAARARRLATSLQIPKAQLPESDADDVDHALVFSRANPSSIVSCVIAARENLRNVREQCSSEMWEQLNRLYLKVSATDREQGWVAQIHQFFHAVEEGAHLFQGITDSTMSHGEGWQYIQLGRYVERVDDLAALVAAYYSGDQPFTDQPAEGDEYLEWVGLLKSCTAFEAYCKVYTAEMQPLRVAEFLLLNSEFPHSLRFSVEHVHSALQLVGARTGRKIESASRLTGKLRAALSFASIDEIMAEGPTRYLAGIQRQCVQVDGAVRHLFFDYPVESTLAS